MNVLTEEDLVRSVQECLDRHQPKDFKLRLVRDAIHQDDDWWYVTVVPEPASVQSYDYAAVLTEVEEIIRNETGTKLLLVPTLASD